MSHKITRRASTVAPNGDWTRSSRCTPGNNCIELRLGREMISVRDSKSVDSEVLTFTRDRWICFLRHVVR
jgi:hypothetical protein